MTAPRTKLCCKEDWYLISLTPSISLTLHLYHGYILITNPYILPLGHMEIILKLNAMIRNRTLFCSSFFQKLLFSWYVIIIETYWPIKRSYLYISIYMNFVYGTILTLKKCLSLELSPETHFNVTNIRKGFFNHSFLACLPITNHNRFCIGCMSHNTHGLSSSYRNTFVITKTL